MTRDRDDVEGFLTRRGFIRAIAVSALGGLVPACTAEHWSVGFRPPMKRVTPFITANQDFYLVAVDPDFRPAVNPANVADQWSLELTGLGGDTVRLTYAALREMAKDEISYTFECIGNPVGGTLIGNARWRVVSLKTVLAKAPGGYGGSGAVLFEGLDDFFSSVSLQRSIDDYAFLAVDMNGVPLPAGHGFPARVILPDLYGMKQPRWLRRITLLESSDTTSYWEQRGWAGEVPVKTFSRLDPPGPLPGQEPAAITGVAFAGVRGIARVEVSLDGGKRWRDCELLQGGSENVWSTWKYVWPQPTKGRHRLRVRAVDGLGRVQTAHETDASPDGASGYHARTIQVV